MISTRELTNVKVFSHKILYFFKTEEQLSLFSNLQCTRVVTVSPVNILKVEFTETPLHTYRSIFILWISPLLPCKLTRTTKFHMHLLSPAWTRNISDWYILIINDFSHQTLKMLHCLYIFFP